MSRATITLTNSFQLVSSGVVTITVLTEGNGALVFNETATDSNANFEQASKEDQFIQTEAKDTYVRTTGEGWIILVDGTI